MSNFFTYGSKNFLPMIFICMLLAAQPTLYGQEVEELPKEGIVKVLGQAHLAYQQARYEEALKLLQALDQVVLDDTQAVQRLSLIGSIHIALGNEELAGEAFLKILALDKDFQLPQHTSPKIVRFFERMRIALNELSSMKINNRPVVDPGQPIRLRVENVKIPEGAVVNIYVGMPLANGPIQFIPIECQTTVGPIGCEGTIPVAHTHRLMDTQNLNYYVKTTSSDGHNYYSGSEEKPLSVELIQPFVKEALQVDGDKGKASNWDEEKIAEEKKKKAGPWYLRWWAITGGGIITAGIITGAALLIHSATKERNGTIIVSVNVAE